MQPRYCTLSGGVIALLISLLLFFAVWQQNHASAMAPAATKLTTAQQPLTGVMRIDSSSFHTCVITSSGGVKCWGANGQGQLGDGSTTYRSLAVAVGGLSKPALDLAVGDHHTCVVTNNGAVQCWGDNSEGQLGNDPVNQSLTPVMAVGLAPTAAAVVAGAYHTCALVGGGVFCWGNNDAGQVGDGTFIRRRQPTPVAGLGSGVIALAAGDDHTCALLTGGAIHCWGSNGWGQLGNDKQNNGSSTPVIVQNLTGAATALTVGDHHSCAIVNGGLWCWGGNHNGQLGDGSLTNQPLPVAVTAMSSGVVNVVGGLDFTCALRADGSNTTAYCWGANWNGALGDGTTEGRRTPMPVVGLRQNVIALAAGGHTACALVEAVSGVGSVQCWGANREGQLGDGALLYRAFPAPVADLPTPATAVATGGSHTCAIQASKLFCWGANGYHQLGVTDRGVSTRPLVVTDMGNTAAVSAGENHTCAVRNGALFCWGFNWAGQLGNGSLGQSGVTPVIGLTTGVATVDAGAAHTCALTQRGAASCWGANWDGRLGDGSVEKRLTPAAVQGVPAPVATIHAGAAHTCALTTGGAVFCWGDNSNGQLGDGTTQSRTQATAVSGLSSDVTAIAVGANHSCALVQEAGNESRVRCWGANRAGQLGDGSNANLPFPGTVQGLPAQIQQITAGGDHTCVLTSEGAVYCWGANRYGQLGDTTTFDRTQPVAVNNLTNGATALAAGDNHTCAVTSSGNVLCWGLDNFGQLGSGVERWRGAPADVMEEVVAPPVTPTVTPTITPTSPAATATPTGPATTGDAFEPDDACAAAGDFAPNGAIQTRTFHQTADQDWVRFAVTAGITHTIEADAPAPSPADLVLALYAQCNSGAIETQDYDFSPNVRLTFVPTTSGVYYLRLRNQQSMAYGRDVAYQLSVRAWGGVHTPGALIIVAGRQREGDPLQTQIHNVTNRVYRLWRNQGYPAERIRYLATDLNLDPDRDGRADVNGLPDQENLRSAITQWAVDKVGPTQALTLYLIDHGGYDTLYLDEPRRERLSPQQLDQWLSQLESAAPGVKITVLVEACNAGSFIDPAQSVSKAGRIVISSAGAYELAWATSSGALFSDALLDGLAMGKSLLGAFYEAAASARTGLLNQTPWLDDDGDRVPNDPDDGALAAQSSFRLGGSLAATADLWQPYIVWGEVRRPTGVDQRGALHEIWAEVRDDRTVQSVLAVIYPPSYQPPTRGEELVAGPPPITLQARGNDRYAGSYGDFTEIGEYRIFIYARDNDGLHSPVKTIQFNNGSQLFLPLARR